MKKLMIQQISTGSLCKWISSLFCILFLVCKSNTYICCKSVYNELSLYSTTLLLSPHSTISKNESCINNLLLRTQVDSFFCSFDLNSVRPTGWLNRLMSDSWQDRFVCSWHHEQQPTWNLIRRLSLMVRNVHMEQQSVTLKKTSSSIFRHGVLTCKQREMLLCSRLELRFSSTADLGPLGRV